MAFNLESKRLKLHQMLKDFTDDGNVYYQPPSNVKLEYPCIIYSLRDLESNRADNADYVDHAIFDISYIHREVDDEALGALFSLPYTIFDRHYVSENLYHDTFIMTL